MGVQMDTAKVAVVNKAVENVAEAIADDFTVLVQKYGFSYKEAKALSEKVYDVLYDKLTVNVGGVV